MGMSHSLKLYSALHTETSVFANRVDPDETAHNEPSHQNLHCLQFSSRKHTYIILTPLNSTFI